MYCPQCGATNDDAARFCTTCGLDLERYKEQWRTPGSQRSRPAQGTYPPLNQQQAPYYSPPPYGGTPYQPGPYQSRSGYGAMPHVPSYMGWAIAVLILCFWPTGIPAVVYASRVSERLAIGDVAGAQEASRKAKMWCWITFGISIAFLVIGLLAAFFLAVPFGITGTVS